MSDVSTEVILARLEDFRADMKEDLTRIESKVDKTNGRVTALELWRHGLAVIAEHGSWRRPAIIGLIAGCLAAATGAISTVLLTIMMS
jgi:hypothetical protein